MEIMATINFDYLQDSQTFGDQKEAADRLVKLYLIDDARDVILNSRLFLETTIKKVFNLENLDKYYPLKEGERRNLRNDTQYLRERLDFPLVIFNLMDEVRRMGNDAAHDPNYKFTNNQAWHCLMDVHDILVFLINSYENQNLAYMRPDIAMDAAENKNDRFRKRQKSRTKTDLKTENVNMAKEVLAHKKKKRGFKSRIKHLFKH